MEIAEFEVEVLEIECQKYATILKVKGPLAQETVVRAPPWPDGEGPLQLPPIGATVKIEVTWTPPP